MNPCYIEKDRLVPVAAAHKTRRKLLQTLASEKPRRDIYYSAISNINSVQCDAEKR